MKDGARGLIYKPRVRALHSTRAFYKTVARDLSGIVDGQSGLQVQFGVFRDQLIQI